MERRRVSDCRGSATLQGLASMLECLTSMMHGKHITGKLHSLLFVADTYITMCLCLSRSGVVRTRGVFANRISLLLLDLREYRFARLVVLDNDVSSSTPIHPSPPSFPLNIETLITSHSAYTMTSTHPNPNPTSFMPSAGQLKLSNHYIVLDLLSVTTSTSCCAFSFTLVSPPIFYHPSPWFLSMHTP